MRNFLSLVLLLALVEVTGCACDCGSDKKIDPISLVQPARQDLEIAAGIPGADSAPASKIHALALADIAAAPGGGPPAVATTKFQIGIFAFGISNTRSRHNDTDFVSCDVSVDGQKVPALVKSMGDLNNGIYPINLYLPAINVRPDSTIVFNYSIVNAGHGDPAQVQKAISTGVGTALDNSNVDEPWKSIAKAAVQLGQVLFFANCDGPVAGDQFTFKGSDMINWAQPGHNYTRRVEYHGGDTPSGCGSNSFYDVTWAIIRE